MDKLEYYEKSIIVKHINIKNIVLKIVFVIIMVIFNSCSVKKIYNKTNTVIENIDNIEINKSNSSNNVEIELLINDYRIINYSEELFYEDFIRYDLQIEIINIEKILQLKDIIYPEICLEYNNKIF